ncbi:uncharacterized protein J8A68_000526 [[Candida] subhashii]|uniref:Early meiotic induction protein 1 n=1 Tax=[Candida] subhashii TaxID=561895 RepID=A0A8J5QT65_9ASCO|nr:uncharacterized protein J8A68_000526 [[Candida] subhashii]KAG7665903.1 hypothetical protein J8A68_000526 [[Candida] subhashii]
MVSDSEKELNELWKLFEDSPKDIQERRQTITKTLHEDQNKDYPSQVAITTAFDELLSCFSFGGQGKNYFRYGSLDLCARQREKLWFAMRHGTLTRMEEKPVYEMNPQELEKRVLIQEFFKKRVLEDKAKGSSEDIWDERKEPLDKPFTN